MSEEIAVEVLEDKTAIREEISELVAEFLARGGEIIQVPAGACGTASAPISTKQKAYLRAVSKGGKKGASVLRAKRRSLLRKAVA